MKRPWNIRNLLRIDKRITSGSDRDRERYRRVALTAVASAIARGTSFLTTLVIIPIVIRFAGSEGYGLWAAVFAMTALFVVADLGIGNGVISLVAGETGDDADERIRTYVSTGFFCLAAIFAALALLLVFGRDLIPWAQFFNVHDGAGAEEASTIATAVLVAFLATLPLGVAARVQEALQEGYVVALWTMVGALAGLVGAATAFALGASLPVGALFFAAGAAIGALCNTIHLFWIRRPQLRPRFTSIELGALTDLSKRGGYFAVIGIASAVAYHADPIVIARILGPESVAEYAVTLKLFLIAPTVLGFVLTPLWPAYREAVTRGDTAWVTKTFRRSLKVAVWITGIPALILLLTSSTIIESWVGTEVVPPQSLVAWFAVWTFIMGVTGPVAMLLNGINALRIQLVLASTMAVINLGLAIFLTGRVGVEGPVIASVVTQTFVILVPIGIYLRRELRSGSLRERAQGDPKDFVTEPAPRVAGLYEGSVSGSDLQ